MFPGHEGENFGPTGEVHSQQVDHLNVDENSNNDNYYYYNYYNNNYIHVNVDNNNYNNKSIVC